MYAALSEMWKPVNLQLLEPGQFRLTCKMVCACTTYLALDTNFSSVLKRMKSASHFPCQMHKRWFKRLQKYQPHNKSHICRFARRCFIELHELWTTTRRYKYTQFLSGLCDWFHCFCAAEWCVTLHKMLQRAVTWKWETL